MSVKDRQLNVRITPSIDRWLEEVAGGRDQKADYVRRLIERDRRRRQEDADLEMFNRAAADLTEGDREDRERLVDAFSNREANR